MVVWYLDSFFFNCDHFLIVKLLLNHLFGKNIENYYFSDICLVYVKRNLDWKTQFFSKGSKENLNKTISSILKSLSCWFYFISSYFKAKDERVLAFLDYFSHLLAFFGSFIHTCTIILNSDKYQQKFSLSFKPLWE